MSIEKNVQTVKDFFGAIGSGDKQGLLALSAEDHRVDHSGRGLAAGRHAPRARGVGGCASEGVRTGGNVIPSAAEYVAQGDRVLVVGVAIGKIKATNKPFEDDWVFAITVRNGK